VLPLAFEEALGFEVMVDLQEQSAFAGPPNQNRIESNMIHSK
jgi:hypothetical protein